MRCARAGWIVSACLAAFGAAGPVLADESPPAGVADYRAREIARAERYRTVRPRGGESRAARVIRTQERVLPEPRGPYERTYTAESPVELERSADRPPVGAAGRTGRARGERVRPGEDPVLVERWEREYERMRANRDPRGHR